MLRLSHWPLAKGGNPASRLKSRVQLTTDGLKVYVDAVEYAFGADVDYAQLVKSYTSVIEGQKRYSPAQCCGAVKSTVTGSPDHAHVNTSYVASVHLHNFFYNFCRIHKTLRTTPAMAAGITDRVWGVEDIIAIMEKREAPIAKPSGLVPVRRKSA